MDQTKTFDSIAMKHTAAAALSAQLHPMTIEEQLAFWQRQTEALKQQQQQQLATTDLAPGETSA